MNLLGYNSHKLDQGENMLTKELVLKLIRENRQEIKKFGVTRLGLFGSVAKGKQRGSSDLDFVVELHPKTFDAYMGLKIYLENLFGCKVDLVLPNTLKSRLRDRILGELLDAA